MRIGAITAAVATLAVAAMAQAGIDVSTSRTAYNASFDEIKVIITGYNGIDAVLPGAQVTLLDGAFTATGGSISVPGTQAQLPSRTTNGSFPGSDFNPPRSIVNFDSAVSAAFTTFVSSAPNTATAFNGTWFTTDSNSRLTPSTTGSTAVGTPLNLLVDFYVTTGANLSFAGLVGTTSQIQTQPLTFSTVPVPEPTALGALGLGAAALLRRRKA